VRRLIVVVDDKWLTNQDDIKLGGPGYTMLASKRALESLGRFGRG
jgi:hypothetical protein